MSEQNILATIDGVNITDADLDAYIANLPKEQQAYAAYPQFREHALKQLLAFHLYAKMAEEEKMDETDEFMQAFYKENPQHFEKGETVHAKHILVDSEEKAQDIMNKITAGDIYFEDAAKEFSSCPSNAQGGDLGEFGKGQMVPEFDQAVFAAEVGKVVGPVKTQFGYHLIKVEDKKDASVTPFDEVKEQIRANLLQQKQNQAYTEKYKELHDKYMK